MLHCVCDPADAFDALTSWRWPCFSWTSQTDDPFPVTECKPAGRKTGQLQIRRLLCTSSSLFVCLFLTSKIKSTILLLGLRSSCWNRTLSTSPSKASRTALQMHSLWQTSSRPDSLDEETQKGGKVSFYIKMRVLNGECCVFIWHFAVFKQTPDSPFFFSFLLEHSLDKCIQFHLKIDLRARL